MICKETMMELLNLIRVRFLRNSESYKLHFALIRSTRSMKLTVATQFLTVAKKSNSYPVLSTRTPASNLNPIRIAIPLAPCSQHQR